MDQGEFGTSSSVADIIEVECEEVYAEQYVRISANELYSRCDKQAVLATPYEPCDLLSDRLTSGPSFSVELDNDGNATAVVLGGPSCAAGESLIAAHLEVGSVHDGDDRLHGAAAAADRTGRVRHPGEQGRG